MHVRSLIACGCLAPLLIAATKPLRLEPSSPWVVDYAAESCRLVRTFGDGKTLTRLAFESEAPGEMDMLVVGRPLQTDLTEVLARIEPVNGQAREGTVARTATSSDPAIIWSNVQMRPDPVAQWKKYEEEQHRKAGTRPQPISVAEQAADKAQQQAFTAAVAYLQIETRPGHPIVLATGSLERPMKAFQQCSRDSLKDWGLDADVEDKIVQPVWAENPGQLLSSRDYPEDMIWRGKESQVDIRLLVDASGRVTKCTSLTHYDEKEFNRITCDAITKRGRFLPAELSDGTKVPSYYTARVNFRIAL